MKLTIGRKISLGYIIILTLTVITGITSIIVLRSSRTIDRLITEVNLPTLDRLKELHQVISLSAKLTNDWIYQPSQTGKTELEKIHAEAYPDLLRAIHVLEENWTSEEVRSGYQSLNAATRTLFEKQKQIMSVLNTPTAYDSAELIEAAIAVMDAEITPRASEITQNLIALIEAQQQNSNRLTERKYTSFNTVEIVIITVALLSILAGVGFAYFSINAIKTPVLKLRDLITDLSKGMQPGTIAKISNDEVGDMVDASNALIDGMRKTSHFANEIGKGNLDADFTALGVHDILGQSLLTMRSNLKKNAEEEYKRNWATRGLAEIASLMRSQNLSLEELYDKTISFVVKYTQSNQGALFLLNTENKNNEYLQLVACYAYERKKYLEKKIEIGQGLIGQCFLERETIYMLAVPKEYVRITSGLGDAPPNCLLIVPLKVNEEIHGVMEVASFTKFEKYQTEFIEKLAESIAAAIGMVRTSERTKQLLTATQQQAEELRAQEEEMRQNMEEMQATQEEMSRKEKEYLHRIEALEALTK
jgi:methyl-accepting chemotaxis protein